MNTLQYPLHYLDFETFNPAVPMFDGTWPYQIIPFQFSLHVVDDEKSEPEHYSFLAEGTEDPRPNLLSELRKEIMDTGSIVVYNKAFEIGILSDLADAFPEYQIWIEDVLGRIVDLLVPFRSFHYYHPLQRGSASLKSVLPAVTGKGYESIEIADGETASIAFQQITYGNVPEEKMNKVKEDLEKYCGMDTEGMIWIMDKLQGL